MIHIKIAVLALLLSACAEFETKIQQQQIQGIPDQLTCSSTSNDLSCAGWKTEEE
jgi:hypothetical protein